LSLLLKSHSESVRVQHSITDVTNIRTHTCQNWPSPPSTIPLASHLLHPSSPPFTDLLSWPSAPGDCITRLPNGSWGHSEVPSAPGDCVTRLPNGSWGHSEVPWASVESHSPSASFPHCPRCPPPMDSLSLPSAPGECATRASTGSWEC
jgi:hypothetical protein